MDYALIAEQILNGLQSGVTLFLTAAGLTLVFGIVGLINLTHGTLVMLGAFTGATVSAISGLFWLGLFSAVLAALSIGLLLEVLIFRKLYRRDHLDQVLATFALILFFNELTRIAFGRQPFQIEPPAALSGSVHLFGDLNYPVYRLVVIAVGILVALLLWALIAKSRLGMLIRAGSTHRDVVSCLGVNVSALFLAIFALSASLAGLAGAIVAPQQAVEVGMGEQIIILAFVVIVIGGVGSVKGALLASVLVGITDALGRSVVPLALASMFEPTMVASISGAFAAMSAYIVLVAVLIWRPQGLFLRT